MRKRVIDTNVHQVTEYKSLEHFLLVNTIPPGISSIWEGGLPIDLLVSPTSSDTTIFFFHGAIERGFTLPVLSGLGISGGLAANRIFLSDPSLMLDDELLLAWYAGSSKQPNLQKILTKVLKKIVESLGSKKIIFFGGSGGGFASLYFASHFDNSLALVFNPQTNIAKYSERAVRDFAVKAFGVSTNLPDPLAPLPSEVVVDLCSIYKTAKPTTIAYLQNLNDTAHVHAHLTPFSQSLHADNEFYVLKGLWGAGHTPPPRKLLSEVLDLAVTSNNWSKDFKDLGFKGA